MAFLPKPNWPSHCSADELGMSIDLREQLGARPRWTARNNNTQRNNDTPEENPPIRPNGGLPAMTWGQAAAPFLAPGGGLGGGLGGGGVAIRLHEFRRLRFQIPRRLGRGEFRQQPIRPSGEELRDAAGRGTRYHLMQTPSVPRSTQYQARIAESRFDFVMSPRRLVLQAKALGSCRQFAHCSVGGFRAGCACGGHSKSRAKQHAYEDTHDWQSYVRLRSDSRFRNHLFRPARKCRQV
jgi:hypothetical protein